MRDENNVPTRNSHALDDALAEQLMEVARASSKHAYAPYSSFSVGAAVLTDDGSIIAGANIENASFGLTVCGERVAIFNAVAAGHRIIRVVAVSAPHQAGTTPCGACRQVMNEFKPADGDLVVVLDDADGLYQITLDELLPGPFGPRDLD